MTASLFRKTSKIFGVLSASVRSLSCGHLWSSIRICALTAALLGFSQNAHATITNGENASAVFGQDDGFFTGNVTYTQNGANDIGNALGFGSGNGGGFALDSTNHRLFVSDTVNARVLVYNLNSSNMLTSGTLAGMEANNVLGQANFRNIQSNQGAGTPNLGTMSQPSALAFDATNNRLFVSDTSNNRILVYNTSTITNGMNPSYELGQASGVNAFTVGTANQGNASPSQSSLDLPRGVAFDATDEWLFVTDNTNNRVLIFNVAPASIANGENALYELGQVSGGTAFTVGTANQGNASPSQSSLSGPRASAFDSTNGLLYVPDDSNNRVMVFNVAPSYLSGGTGGVCSSGSFGNGENACYELGQASGGSAFTVGSANQGNASPSQSSLNLPSGAAYDGTNGRLFVADYSNNRVMVFNTSSISNGENAAYELGQPSGTAFTSHSAATTQSGLNAPFSGLLYDSSNTLLYMTDSNNSRIMIFNVATGTIANGENASNEMGQDDGTFAGNVSYTTSGANDTPNAFSVGNFDQDGIALDATNHRFFVSDSTNNRVLVYNLNTDNSINSVFASNVLGQANFRGSSAVFTQSGMSSPGGVVYDSVNNRLFVADVSNNRVLVFSTSTITNGMNASYELGQPSGGTAFTTHSAATTQSGMSNPKQIAFDSTNELLYVAEGANNRVTVWNVAPASIANGETASYVLGQTSWTAGSANQGGSASQSTLSNPSGVAIDIGDQMLFVADRSNNRVMVFNVAPSYLSGGTGGACSSGSSGNGENACYELGQPSGTAFTSVSSATTQSGMSTPYGVAFDGNSNRLFVTDSANNRVLIFNNATPGTIANGENASFELGQPSGATAFTTKAAVTTQSGVNTTLSFPAYCACNSMLYFKDTDNNRVLVFDVTAISINPQNFLLPGYE